MLTVTLQGILKPFWYGNLYIVLMSRVDEGRVHTGTATGRLVSINPVWFEQ